MKVFSFSKTKVKVFGGFNTIGGNCIVIESPSLKIMLDQGVNFTQLKKFYGFSIKPESVEELREMKVLPPREAYEGVEEIYVSHLHLDHLGSLNIPGGISVYLPSKEVAEVLSRSWWFGWKQHLFPQTLSFTGFKNIEESKRIKYERISHSAFPSFALRIDTEDVSILYTGDLRLTSVHKVVGDPKENLEKLSEDGVDVAIMEGTNFGRRMNYLTPIQFKQIFKELIEKYDRDILFVTAHPLDLESMLSILEMLWENKYTPVFTNIYYAHVLDAMINIVGYEVENELIFAASSTKIRHLDNFEYEFSISSLRDRKTAFFISATGIREIKSIVKLLDKESKGLIHITVLGEPASEEWIIEEKIMSNWLKILGITSYRIHVSGHYHPYEFKEFIHIIKSKKIIPIHTTVPRIIKELFEKYVK
mgnify:CR=1 FL=1